jgi:hypothetical protein
VPRSNRLNPIYRAFLMFVGVVTGERVEAACNESWSRIVATQIQAFNDEAKESDDLARTLVVRARGAPSAQSAPMLQASEKLRRQAERLRALVFELESGVHHLCQGE